MAESNSSNPTWEPRLILDDGRVVRLPGGLSHASAITAAEAAAEKLENVEYVSARLERNEVAA